MGTLACGKLETYAEDVRRLRSQLPEIVDAIEGFTSVAQVVDCLAACSSGRAALDMIGMDEFEYDFIVEIEPSGRWLAFGVT